MRMRSHVLTSVLLVAALALVRAAPAAAQASAYADAFDAWVTKHWPATAIVVVRRQGQTIFRKGHNADPRAPLITSSLSKAITGVCIATLIRDGRLAFTTPLRQALAGFFRRHGPPADARLLDATIEQLLTHRSGLRGKDEDDPMYEIWDRRAMQGQAHEASPEPLLAEHFRYRLAYDPGSRQSYSNAGFVTLSSIIEEATGKPYEDYCRAAVFDKLGITRVRLHPDWRQLTGARGWLIAAEDYLAFLDVFDRSNLFLGDTVKRWMLSAQTRWTPDNRGQFDALGIVMSIRPSGWRVLHSGVIDVQGKDAHDRPIRVAVNSFAYREPTGYSAFQALTPADEFHPALGELYRAIHRVHERAERMHEPVDKGR
jgi:CubicO group peptidase (beta-lactamase class C family)